MRTNTPYVYVKLATVLFLPNTGARLNNDLLTITHIMRSTLMLTHIQNDFQTREEYANWAPSPQIYWVGGSCSASSPVQKTVRVCKFDTYLFELKIGLDMIHPFQPITWIVLAVLEWMQQCKHDSWWSFKTRMMVITRESVMACSHISVRNQIRDSCWDTWIMPAWNGTSCNLCILKLPFEPLSPILGCRTRTNTWISQRSSTPATVTF